MVGTLCLIQGVLNLALLAVIVALYYDAAAKQGQLLDRVMARDFGEYLALSAGPDKRRTPRRLHMDDASEAVLERAKRGDLHGP